MHAAHALLTEGRRRETSRWRSRVRRPRARLVTSPSGGVGPPPAWPLRAAARSWLTIRERPDESAARCRKENAAVERRKASALRQGRAADAVKHAQTAQSCLLAAVGAPLGAPLPSALPIG